MKILSIVIPTYNMEKYLANCLDSFLIDEILNKIEVIIVNDGSKDSSVDIAQRYVELYPDTYKLIDKENGGHGSTINEGLKCASGKYFRVVDSDDWVDGDSFLKYVCELEKLDVELILTPYVKVDEVTGQKRRESIKLSTDKFGKILDIDEYIRRNVLRMHMITYKTELLKKINLTLDIHSFYVDMEYIHFVVPYITKCCCLNYYVYQYRVNLSTQSCNIVGYIKHRTEHARVILHCIRYRKSRRNIYCSKQVYKYTYKSLYDLINTQYSVYMADMKNFNVGKEIKAFDRALKKQSPELYDSTGKIEYINYLRKSNFRFVLFQQLCFKKKQLDGKYKEIGC